jgi:hypothetical protein
VELLELCGLVSQPPVELVELLDIPMKRRK